MRVQIADDQEVRVAAARMVFVRPQQVFCPKSQMTLEWQGPAQFNTGICGGFAPHESLFVGPPAVYDQGALDLGQDDET